MEGHKQKNGIKKSLYHLLLWAISILFFSPILWMIICSLKTKVEILTLPAKMVVCPHLRKLYRPL